MSSQPRVFWYNVAMADAETKPAILIVEDNPLNMRLAADLLTLNGLQVIEATDGERALELLKDTIPHLILMDIRLPGMDGIELFKKIREDARYAAVKIVALTASVMRDEEQRIKAMGFNDFISKPIDTKGFVARVRSILG